jgi:hypothetical protein
VRASDTVLSAICPYTRHRCRLSTTDREQKLNISLRGMQYVPEGSFFGKFSFMEPGNLPSSLKKVTAHQPVESTRNLKPFYVLTRVTDDCA